MTGSVLSLRERHVNPSNRLSSGNTKAGGEGRQFNQTIVIRSLRVTAKGRTHCGTIQRDTQTSCFIYTHSWLTISLFSQHVSASLLCGVKIALCRPLIGHLYAPPHSLPILIVSMLFWNLPF